ncbi:hypothetical protein OV090_16400 [Nannocystis sp. RBIL2]|uniref:hypothetical protein n=1 Tax=Nannocystis sp. RBIL2 TaxID=2996788 RepID=UPI002270143B|nr:hypothetical protein [Nannocystis sp. RBIL2]MCY1066362.1 hypothetical protein [Nannocystis sp. RBIL2]
MEFAFGLEADELIALADDDPSKQIAPGVWFGEALWSFSFTIPDIGPEPTGALRWRICAVDAAGNKGCGPVYGASVEPPDTCGDGVVDPWEVCDVLADPACIACAAVCGNGPCEVPVENDWNCAEDCVNREPTTGDACGDHVCGVGEDLGCPQDCVVCGDLVCEPGEDERCPADCPQAEDSGDDSASTGGATPAEGCGCRESPAGGVLGLCMGLLARRRRRAAAVQ